MSDAFDHYYYIQCDKHMSHEEDYPKWVDGQKIAVDYFFPDVPLGSVILDAGCGDGIGVAHLESKGFTDVHGMDLNPKKVERALSKGLKIKEGDMHALPYEDNQFDVVYSSHSLEHCHDPVKAVAEIKRVLKPDGDVFIVLPFPDRGVLEVHCGGVTMGSRHNDGGDSVVAWLAAQGFKEGSRKLDSYREVEIWLTLTVEDT